MALSPQQEIDFMKLLQGVHLSQQEEALPDAIERLGELDALFGSDLSSRVVCQRELRDNTLRLIASEAHTIPLCVEAAHAFGLAGRYGAYDEGYPQNNPGGGKYYRGTEFADSSEAAAQQAGLDLLKQLVPGREFTVNVQPLSGATANAGVYAGVLRPGDHVMGLVLSHGGHLTHFSEVSATGASYEAMRYQVEEDGTFDFDTIERQIASHQPRLIVVGGSALPKEVDFKRFAEIAHQHGCLVLADISHTAGHVLSGTMSAAPLETADIITATTHKSGGPKGAVIITPKGIKHQRTGEDKAAPLSRLVQSGLFPGVQGGPNSTNYPALEIWFRSFGTEVMKGWSRRVLEGIQMVQMELQTVLPEGTIVAPSNTHLILLNAEKASGSDGKSGAGGRLAAAMEQAGLIVNPNGFRGDLNGPRNPGGVRIGFNGPARREGWLDGTSQMLGLSIAQLAVAIDAPKALANAIAEVRRAVDELAQKHPIRWDIGVEELEAKLESDGEGKS